MISAAGPDFDDWPGLLDLILTSFAGMTGRIDPPSSALRLTPAALAARAREQALFLAMDNALIGCVFCARQPDALYLGKLAVHPCAQGRGMGRALLQAAEDHARRLSLPRLRLETRLELVENHAAFARVGFAEVSRHAHPGYSRPTTVVMEKPLW